MWIFRTTTVGRFVYELVTRATNATCVQINIQVNEDFRYMKIHIFALRCKCEFSYI